MLRVTILPNENNRAENRTYLITGDFMIHTIYLVGLLLDDEIKLGKLRLTCAFLEVRQHAKLL
jgi:hypothetical protein